MGDRETFEGWAFLELMGHRKLAGLLSEATIGGGSFVRIDVPGGCGDSGVSAVWCPVHGDCRCPNREDLNDEGCPLHASSSEHPVTVTATQFYAPGAVYCITPTTEDMARRYAARCRPAPVEEWELPKRPALPAAAVPAGAVHIDPEDLDDPDDRDERCVACALPLSLCGCES